MRRPRAPATLFHVQQALELRKELDATRETILTEASTKGFRRGSTRYRWNVDITTRRNVLFARLTCAGTVLLNLDHHATPGRIRQGYHWDVRAPFPPDRIPLEPDPASVDDALEYLRIFWNLVFIEGTGRLL